MPQREGSSTRCHPRQPGGGCRCLQPPPRRVHVPRSCSPAPAPPRAAAQHTPKKLSHPAGHPEPDTAPVRAPPPRSKTPKQTSLPNCRPIWAADKQILTQLHWKPSAARQGAGGALGTLAPGRQAGRPEPLGAGRSSACCRAVRPHSPRGDTPVRDAPAPLRARRHSRQPAPLASCHLELALK